MATDPMDKISADFSRWATAPDRKLSGESAADVAETELLLGLMRDHLGLDSPARLNPGDLENLLLNVYPRKVTVFDPEDTQDTIPALRDLLAFLADTGRLAGAAARRLERELDQVAPRFADAVMDPSRWGQARSITQAMVTEGVDITDSAAVQEWIAQYNANASEPLAVPGLRRGGLQPQGGVRPARPAACDAPARAGRARRPGAQVSAARRGGPSGRVGGPRPEPSTRTAY